MILIVIMTIVTFIHSVLLLVVLIYPYRDQLRCGRFTATLTVLLCSVLYTLPFLTRFWKPCSVEYGKFGISCACIILFSLAASRMTGIKFVFLIFTAFIFRNVTDSLYTISRLSHLVFQSSQPIPNAFGPLFYLALISCFTPVLLRFAERDLKPCLEYSSSRTWYFLWMIPFTNYIYFRIFTHADYFTPVSGLAVETVLAPILWLFGTFLTHFILLKMIHEAAQITALKEELKYAGIITDIQSRESLSLQEKLAETRKIRHDMRHHMVVLDGYLRIGDNDSAMEYIRTLVDSIDQLQMKQYCSNHAVNSLLNYYAEKAGSAGIAFTSTVSLKEELLLPDPDFCSILGNLLENALEACLRLPEGQARFITLRLGHAGSKMIALTLKNSYNGCLKTVDGKFMSSKRDARGIGTESVQYMVNKYDGICRFHHTDEVFTVSVMLNPSLR